jgi:hypothetical protein
MTNSFCSSDCTLLPLHAQQQQVKASIQPRFRIVFKLTVDVLENRQQIFSKLPSIEPEYSRACDCCDHYGKEKEFVIDHWSMVICYLRVGSRFVEK